jgi:uncharacterized protein YmfQ (DUF2313 family)
MTLPAARTVDQVLDGLMGEMPAGFAWNGDPASRLGLFFRALADALATFEASAMAQLEEVDPRSAVQLLADYERVLGPDPYGRDRAVLSQAQQRALVFQRWTARGGQSVAYFTALAAALGDSIAITEYSPAKFGSCQFGSLMYGVDWAFAWSIAGSADPVMEAMFQAIKPAHTTLFFT